MMFVLLLLAGAGYGVWQVFGAKRGFTTFTPPGGDCSILMPGTPTEQEIPIDGTKLKVYAVEKWRSGYAIAYADLHGEPFNLQGAVDAIARAREAKVIVQRGDDFDGGSYREFELETKKPSGCFSGRVLIYRDRVYQLFAYGSEARLANPDVKKFLNSFKLDSVRLPWESAANSGPARPPGPRTGSAAWPATHRSGSTGSGAPVILLLARQNENHMIAVGLMYPEKST
jgi:hypothetical protein